MKNQKVTFLNQVNRIFKKSNIPFKLISVNETPKQTVETYDDFDGEYYVEEINPEIIAVVNASIPFMLIMKTQFMKDLNRLQYKWNKKYGIDVDIAFL